MKPKNTIEESLKVPSDILMDVLAVIVKETIRHEITQVIESRGMVILSVYLNDGSLKQQRALQNIQSMLEEYNEYRYSENEELDWRDY
jgi:hypothetical protein